jgi:hypothetical protein
VKVEKGSVIPSRHIHLLEATYVSLRKKKFMFEAAASVALLPVRIELVFVRMTSCQSQFSSWWKSHFVPNSPIQLS